MIELSPNQQRIASLDVLRGFALLGILLMNIQSFSMPGAAYLNPYAFGDLEGANYLVWALSHVFADQKFMSLFSMLFGVGVLIFSQGIEAKGMNSALLHYRRTFWLLVFGLLHGYLFWYGDILFSYAMCGFLVYLLRNKGVTTLFILGLVFVSISSVINTAIGLSIPHIPPNEVTGMSQSWKPTDAFMQKEITEYTAGWVQAFKHRISSTFFMQTYVFLTTFVWRAGGMMLIGMALYKSGFFNSVFSMRRYTWLAVSSMLVGMSLIISGLVANHRNNFSLEYSMFLGSQFNYWGSIAMALCYASIFMIIIKKQWMLALQKRLAAIGRTAFSNYLLQTLICTTLFYHFGYLGTYSRVEQLLTVLLVWVVQILIAPLWLNKYRFGPMEWLWRSLTYWQRQPLLKTK